MRNYFSISLIISFALFTAVFALGTDYIIKPNDTIRTYIFDNPDLNINTEVPPDGMLSFPLVGEINVLGITANQLAKILESKLSFYIIEPKVNVFVTAYNPLKIYVLGAVTNPGALDYKPGDRLTDYITEAGGFNQTADLKKCYIYPKDSTQKETKVNLKKILDKDNPDLDIELKPFDTVYLKQKSGFIFSEWRDIADALSIIVGLFTLYLVISNQR